MSVGCPVCAAFFAEIYVVVLDACHAGIAGSDAFATNEDAVSALMTRAGAPIVVLAGSTGLAKWAKGIKLAWQAE